MSDVRGYESECGELQYFPKKQKCQCCHKVKKRGEFIIRNSNNDDNTYDFSPICNVCREPFAMPVGKMSFRRAGEKCEDISKPSIIDWMYQNANS